MDLDSLLSESEAAVLDEAYTALHHAHLAHYEAAGEHLTRQRLADLFELVASAIRSRDLAALSAYTEKLAEERFGEGFDISEVQAAFNALELALWRRVVAAAPPGELAEAIGLMSTVVGYGKDTLARTYVSLASQRHVPSLDLSALFAGVES
ncbi:hypothetical protein [Nocardioides mesophilus]|uniref:RsbT co-antagonist protein RsbRD N-terminal domain-containing protein n=1 Tax=Nocardioides mesophilus TaxID=433659 RepID=A0A7G9RB64_9ACTN|nr:hypothetical protein [Nocardioides mesophilus]QNN52839.1 hypothetical protein H9L09_20835 [Nocardioides mesophilus]